MIHRPRIEKSVVALVRNDTVLAFRHPMAGVQLPKGTREPGETPEETARREMFEEVGVTLPPVCVALGDWDCPSPVSTWHIFVAEAPRDLPRSWRHAPTGGGDETGLVFDVMWVKMSDALTVFHPLFHPVLGIVRAYQDQVGKARASQS